MPLPRRLVALFLGVLTVTLAPAASFAGPPSSRGPFVALVTRNSAVVRWFTTSPVRGGVRYGLDPRALTHSVWEPLSGLEHQVRLTGLRGATTYYYATVSGDEVAAGRDRYFTTAPDASQPFRFVVFGDSQGEPGTCAPAPAWGRVARLMDRLRPSLVVGVGDYVAEGATPSCWARWLDAAGGLFRHTPFYPAMGNHDYDRQYYTGEDNAGLRNFTRWFALPPGPEPDTATTYYAFTFGNSRFIVLDAYKRRGPGSPQLRWLERELAQASRARDVQHVFVVDHPTFEGVGYFCPEDSRDRNQAQNRAWVEPLLERYGVTAAFSGHEHGYARVEKHGIHYVVTGGGGGTLEGSDRPRCPGTPGLVTYLATTHHAVLVEVDGPRVRYSAIGIDGRRLDSWVDEGRPTGSPPYVRAAWQRRPAPLAR
jgi:acid phosphatase type 7